MCVLCSDPNMYGLLTKCEVKMAGYWPSSFFACLWTETKSRSINSQKKNEANIQSSYRTNLVNKGFIIWLLVKFCLRDTAGGPEWARWLHLARSGSQSQRAIWFILPAHGASHIINICYSPVFTDREVRIGKNCARGLEYSPTPQPRVVLETVHSFYQYGPTKAGE